MNALSLDSASGGKQTRACKTCAKIIELMLKIYLCLTANLYYESVVLCEVVNAIV